VNHPGQWNESGFSDIQKPPKRYAIIDLKILSELNGFTGVRDFQTAHRRWLEQTLESGHTVRDDRWSEAIAVGSLAFVANVKGELGSKALHRTVEHRDERMHYENRATLTTVISAPKVSQARKHVLLERKPCSYGET
jgi:hypothetical protein